MVFFSGFGARERRIHTLLGDDMTIHRIRFAASAFGIVMLGVTAGHAQAAQGCQAVVERQVQRSSALSDLLADFSNGG